MRKPASANDTARLLAGMQPSPDSPLLVMTRDRAWQQHANHLNAIFAKVENHQLTRIQAWSQAKLTSPSPVLFYMFSGPDFLYANAFFPNASTYVMSGLEPTGPVPDLTKLSPEVRARGFRNIEESLSSIVTYSFFQTIDMRRNLAATGLAGVRCRSSMCSLLVQEKPSEMFRSSDSTRTARRRSTRGADDARCRQRARRQDRFCR